MEIFHLFENTQFSLFSGLDSINLFGQCLSGFKFQQDIIIWGHLRALPLLNHCYISTCQAALLEWGHSQGLQGEPREHQYWSSSMQLRDPKGVWGLGSQRVRKLQGEKQRPGPGYPTQNDHKMVPSTGGESKNCEAVFRRQGP